MKKLSLRASELAWRSLNWNRAVPLLIFLGACCCSSSHAATNSLHPLHVEGVSVVPGHSSRDSKEALTWARSLKHLSASPPDSPTLSNTSLILAKDRTARPDPLDNFNKYRQGWDIRNKHYWASVGFTGTPGFVLAAAWLALGLVLLFLLSCCCCCCRDRSKGDHKGDVLFPTLFLIMFTAAAVGGCVMTYIGQGKFHDQLSDTLHYVVNQSDTVVIRLRNTSSVLMETQIIDVATFALSDSEKTQVQQLSTQLTSAANDLETKTNDNAHKIQDGLDNVRLIMIVVAGVMLLFVLLGLLFAVLGAAPLVYLMVFVGWFLVAGTCILCGVYILLNNATGDTCIAMKEWVENPSAKTNLDEILPCVDLNTANKTLDQTKKLTNETITGINLVISNALSRNVPQGVPLICNPVAPHLSSSGCKNLSSAAEALAPYLCNSSDTVGCALQGRLTQDIYNQVRESAKVINDLYENIPFLISLEDCQFVRQAFTEIRAHYCDKLCKYSKLEYVGLALVSGGAMLSILFWIVFTRRRRLKHEYPSYGDKKYGQPIYRGTVQN